MGAKPIFHGMSEINLNAVKNSGEDCGGFLIKNDKIRQLVFPATDPARGTQLERHQ